MRGSSPAALAAAEEAAGHSGGRFFIVGAGDLVFTAKALQMARHEVLQAHIQATGGKDDLLYSAYDRVLALDAQLAEVTAGRGAGLLGTLKYPPKYEALYQEILRFQVRPFLSPPGVT